MPSTRPDPRAKAIMETRIKANICGFGAILLWSISVAFIRSVAESFGAAGGAALAYSLAALLLLARSRSLNLKDLSPIYLFGGGGLFVAYNLLFSQAVGLSSDGQQAIEVALINYLWPCFIILLAVPMVGLRPNWLIVPGLALSFFGVCWCLSEGKLDIATFSANVQKNPLPFILASVGAVFWGIYCNLAKLYGKNSDCIGLFFLIIAAALWIKFLFSGETLPLTGPRPILDLIVSGTIYASSYALWEAGVQRGNMTLLAASSYFIPVLSILFASLWLSVQPPQVFWYGVAMVVAGSLICWAATKNA